MNSFIPLESATLSLNLLFSVSSYAHITRHLGAQEYALSRKIIVYKIPRAAPSPRCRLKRNLAKWLRYGLSQLLIFW